MTPALAAARSRFLSLFGCFMMLALDGARSNAPTRSNSPSLIDRARREPLRCGSLSGTSCPVCHSLFCFIAKRTESCIVSCHRLSKVSALVFSIIHYIVRICVAKRRRLSCCASASLVSVLKGACEPGGGHEAARLLSASLRRTLISSMCLTGGAARSLSALSGKRS